MFLPWEGSYRQWQFVDSKIPFELFSPVKSCENQNDMHTVSKLNSQR